MTSRIYTAAGKNQGISYYGKKEYNRAIEDYTKAIEIDSRNSAAYFNRGLAYNKKEIDRSIADDIQAAQLDIKERRKF